MHPIVRGAAAFLVATAASALDLPPGCPVGVAGVPPAVRRAAADLARDLGRVLGRPSPLVDASAPIMVGIDPGLPAPEGHRVRILADSVHLDGADELGAIHAIYRFSHDHLGVDPCWFWTGRQPPVRERIALAAGETVVGPPGIRWRGLFINDEDLLGRWRQPAGERFAAWPGRTAVLPEYHRRLLTYYTPVVNAEVMEGVCETVLRLGGNLLIPASFVDVMNPPEAALIAQAAARGLWVSQHHVEPLGVGFFAYETWWAARGQPAAFSYPAEPERFRSIWTAYARRWRELAGDRVVWQLGLRGKGDRSAWDGDPAFDRGRAAAVVAQALADQERIIRQVDPRPDPPRTLTLWLEMADLLAGGLAVPAGTVLVAADDARWPGRCMNRSYEAARDRAHPRGAYLHAAVWSEGPHLVQGVAGEDLGDLVSRIAARGDAAYGLVNAANLREHVFPLRAAFARMWDPAAPVPAPTPAALAPLVAGLVAAQRLAEGQPPMSDGRTRAALLRILSGSSPPAADPAAAGILVAGAERLIALATAAESMPGAAQDRRLAAANVGGQARILAGLWRALAGCQRRDRAAAAAGLGEVEAVFAGDPEWYRGDSKVGVRGLQALLRTRPWP